MKTNIFFTKKTLLYPLIVFFSILMTSCGSYQNSSYYDSDGIYGYTETRTGETIITITPALQITADKGIIIMQTGETTMQKPKLTSILTIGTYR